MTEDEMVGGHHRLTGREFEQTLGDAAVHGVANSTTEQLNNHHLVLSVSLIRACVLSCFSCL